MTNTATKTTDTITKAVIYARFSSHGQQEQSIEGQIRDCLSFAGREGYQVVGEYIDRSISGKTDNRPEFQRMIKDAEKRQFSVIIVWKLDRFMRNRYDSAIYKARLKKYGVRVISATEGISDTPEGIMMEGFLESLAEYYSANLSKHVRRGMRESIIRGTSTGGAAPLGYKVVDKKLVIDDDRAHIVRYIFEQYAAGVPLKKITDSLNERGYRTNLGNPFIPTSVTKILKNEKYIGIYKFAAVEEIGSCPAIIDERTFEKVQKMLKKKSRCGGEGKARQEYLLSGKAFCGYCGTRLVGDSGKSRSGQFHYYYSCGKRKKHRACTKLAEKKGVLEWYVVEQTVEFVLAPERMEYIAEAIVKAYKDDFGDAKVKELERRLKKADRDINDLVESLIGLPKKAIPAVGEKIATLETQKCDIEIELSQLRIANGIKYSKEQIMGWLKMFCKGDLLDIDFQRRIIDTFINSVYLYDDKVAIYYNIQGSEQVSYIEMLESTERLEEPECASVRIDNNLPHHNHNPLQRKGFAV